MLPIEVASAPWEISTRIRRFRRNFCRKSTAKLEDEEEDFWKFPVVVRFSFNDGFRLFPTILVNLCAMLRLLVAFWWAVGVLAPAAVATGPWDGHGKRPSEPVDDCLRVAASFVQILGHESHAIPHKKVKGKCLRLTLSSLGSLYSIIYRV